MDVKDEWEGQEWMGAGNFVDNPRCQRLHFEVKMHQKTIGGRAMHGPAGGA
jgi:hypothetical protein